MGRRNTSSQFYLQKAQQLKSFARLIQTGEVLSYELIRWVLHRPVELAALTVQVIFRLYGEGLFRSCAIFMLSGGNMDIVGCCGRNELH
jgi:hypothetical protein